MLSSSIFADKVKHLSHKQICPIQLAQEIRDLILEVADSCKIIRAKPNNQNKPLEEIYLLKKQLGNLIKKNKYTYKKSIVDGMCSNLGKGEMKAYILETTKKIGELN